MWIDLSYSLCVLGKQMLVVLIIYGLCLQDGTQVQIRSVVLNKYVSAANGGGSNVTVDRDVASTWETFRVRSACYVLV